MAYRQMLQMATYSPQSKYKGRQGYSGEDTGYAGDIGRQDRLGRSTSPLRIKSISLRKTSRIARQHLLSLGNAYFAFENTLCFFGDACNWTCTRECRAMIAPESTGSLRVMADQVFAVYRTLYYGVHGRDPCGPFPRE